MSDFSKKMFRLFLVSFLALALSVVPALSQSLTLLGAGGSGSSLIPNGLTYISTQSCTLSSGLCTITSANLGVAQANRYIAVMGNTGVNCAMTFVVNSVAATNLKNVALANATTAIAVALVPTGATGNIDVTCSGGSTGAAISWYTIYGLNSLTPDSTGQGSNGTVITLNPTNASGYILSATEFSTSGQSGAITGTGAVLDYNLNIGSNTGSGGHAAGTGSSYNVQWNTGLSNVASAVAIH